MNQNLRRVESRLRSERISQPPADLGERLKSEIPDRPVVRLQRPAVGARRFRTGMLLAASLATAVVGVSIAYRVNRTQDRQGSVLTVRAAPHETAEIQRLQPAMKEPVVQEAATPAATPTPRSSKVSPPAPGLNPDPDRDEARKEIASPQRASVKSSTTSQAPPITDTIQSLRGMRSRQSAEALAFVPSTGGTAEPNDQPYGDMFFKSAGVNPFVATEDDALSTFGLDVDTGSYTLARSYLERGHLPPAESIRVEEFVNYFDYGDAPPASGDFALTAETAPTPFGSGSRYQLMRIAVRGREIDASARQAATLIFVVDVSGSMARENRLGLVKRSLYLLLDQLRSDDRVGLVVYGARGSVLLEPTHDLEAMRSAIDRLQTEGSTNIEEGLLLGYELAERFHQPGAIHRVILLSDGVANVGRTGPDSILERIGEGSDRGIELSTIGFGMGNFNDHLMEQLADRGDGMYAYVDTLAEARRVLVRNLTGMLQTIASEARVQVEFDPAVVERYRLLGYENRDIADQRFRDDTVDAGEIGAGHSVTALYEVKLEDGAEAEDILAVIRLRYYSKASERFVELEQRTRVGEIASSWSEASSGLRLASVVAEFAEILRGAYWAREGDLHDLFLRAQALSSEFPGDHEVADFVSLTGRADRLQAATSVD